MGTEEEWVESGYNVIPNIYAEALFFFFFWKGEICDLILRFKIYT